MAVNAQGQTIYQAPTVNGRVQTVTNGQPTKPVTQTNTQAPRLAVNSQGQTITQKQVTSTGGYGGITPVPNNVGNTITTGNTRNAPPTVLPNVTQPTQGAMLSADIQSGQEATNRAREAEMAVSRTQGLDTTTQAKQIADYIAGKTATSTPQGTTTPTTGTSPTNAPVDAVSQYKTNFEQSQADLMTALNTAQGQTALQDQAYSGTVDPAKQELNDINQRLNEETLAGRRRVEAVLTIPGITKAQAQDKINEISRVNTSTQADLAIIQMAKQGQYDSAKEIADRKVSALVEEQKIKIDTLKFVYDNNKELFTKAEQRQFEVAQADRERKLNQEEKRLNDINALTLSAIEQGAPTAVARKMFQSKSVAEAAQYGTPYIGKLDREVKLANIRQSDASAEASYASASKSRAEQKLLNNNGITTPVSDKYAGVLNTILGSQNLTKEQKLSITKAVNSGQDPVQVIKNQAKNIMGQTEATQLGKFETAKQATVDLEKSLKEYYANGGSTNIFKGNIEKTINKLGEVQDPKLVSLSTEIALQLQLYRNAISGTAYSEQEGRDITSVFPGINKSSGLNQAIIDGKRRAYDSQIDNTYRNTLGSVYDELKPKPVTQTSVANNPYQAAIDSAVSDVKSVIYSPNTGYILPNTTNR